VSDPVFDPVLSFNMRVYWFIVALFLRVVYFKCTDSDNLPML